MTENQFNEISAWQKKTFGEATSLSKIAHLKDEIGELQKELNLFNDPYFVVTRPSIISKEREFADCFLLLFGAAAADGMSFQDICDCIDDKMKINKARKWGKPDENGVVNHIKE